MRAKTAKLIAKVAAATKVSKRRLRDAWRGTPHRQKGRERRKLLALLKKAAARPELADSFWDRVRL